MITLELKGLEKYLTVKKNLQACQGQCNLEQMTAKSISWYLSSFPNRKGKEPHRIILQYNTTQHLQYGLYASFCFIITLLFKHWVKFLQLLKDNWTGKQQEATLITAVKTVIVIRDLESYIIHLDMMKRGSSAIQEIKMLNDSL